MKYIIENSSVNIYGKMGRKSFLIENGKITYTSPQAIKLKSMRIHSSPFVLSPGSCMLDFEVLFISDFVAFKERMRYLHSIGCTALVTAFQLEHEHQFFDRLKKAKHALINSSIDYLITMRVPLARLTPALVRKCCRYKLPIIFTDIYEVEEIERIAWQWIRNELFPYQLMIVPIWHIPDSSRQQQRGKLLWEQLLKNNKISTQVEPLKGQSPLSKEFLLSSGIYPDKSSLLIGTAADYLLFRSERTSPDIVVANGIVKKAGERIYFQPGSGKELTVVRPRKLQHISQAFPATILTVDY